MANSILHYRIRRIHRFLGVIIGVQFLMWTLGGLYFSWSDMDEVHGDYELNHSSTLPSRYELLSPSIGLDSLKKAGLMDSIAEVRLVGILNRPYWQTTYQITNKDGHHYKTLLWDAVTGNFKLPLSEQEAVEVARTQYLGNGKVTSVEYITETGKHHEYREEPLPAYVVTFDDSRHTSFYVSSELGTVIKARNQPWRQFDFLWMMHTMDYTSRDNITNWLLRAFSIFGLATVASGFALFFVSIRKNRSVNQP